MAKKIKKIVTIPIPAYSRYCGQKRRRIVLLLQSLFIFQAFAQVLKEVCTPTSFTYANG
jgi:hypothetical protein